VAKRFVYGRDSSQLLPRLSFSMDGGALFGGAAHWATHDPSEPEVYEVAREASRTDGVAPLSVHFTAGFNSSTATDRPFHDRFYWWDFGEGDIGNWATSGKPKGTASGPVTAHVFETPGTYTVSLAVISSVDGSTIDTDTFTITVSDPDVVYAGLATTCVNQAGDTDFTGAPTGAREISTDDLSTITQYATAGSRILLKRGGAWSWSGDGNEWSSNSGPVTIGCYGDGDKPQVDIADGSHFLWIDMKRDWRVTDLHFVNTQGSSTYTTAINGVIGMQRILLMGVDTDGCSIPLGWSHWHPPNGHIMDMAIVECTVTNPRTYGVYCGAERLVVMGNTITDAGDSHALRVWQAYEGIVAHNTISGTSINSGTGRQALKLHGPQEEDVNDNPIDVELRNRSQFIMVSDNIFGQSGPWPVSIGPQDNGQDERLSDILVDRNRFITEYGTFSQDIQISLRVVARYVTVKNNVMDGTGPGGSYRGVGVVTAGIVPPTQYVSVIHNSIYRNTEAHNGAYGVEIDGARDSVVENNLVSFPSVTAGNRGSVLDAGTDSQLDSNLFENDAGFTDPDNTEPLLRDFKLLGTSVAIGQGVSTSAIRDFDHVQRSDPPDIGAFEYQE